MRGFCIIINTLIEPTPYTFSFEIQREAVIPHIKPEKAHKRLDSKLYEARSLIIIRDISLAK